jgi:hypothetical protein
VCDEGTSGLLHAGGHFPEPRQFFFCMQRQNCFLLCIHVELTAALGRLDTSVFPKFVVLEFEVMKDLIVLSALKLSH